MVLRLLPHDDPRVLAVRTALAGCAWWTCTAEMLGRQVLGAVDGHEPVEHADERLRVLVDFLTTCQWRTVTLVALSRRLVSVLDHWWHQQLCLDIELRWLLDQAD